MKKTIYFYLCKPDIRHKLPGNVTMDQFEEIKADFPEFCKVVPNPCFIDIVAPREGERTQKLLNHIESIGLRPYWAKIPHVNKMPREERWLEIKGKIEFDSKDFEAAKFFDIYASPSSEMGEGDHYEDRTAFVRRFDPNFPVGYIVSVGEGYLQESMRDKFIGANFSGLVLREEQIAGVPFPLWHMESDREMPPSANLWYQDPTFRDKAPNYALFYTSIYSPCPMEYRAVDLEKMIGVDFAYSQEWLSNGPPTGFRKLICSKRFYDWAKTNNLPFDFVPVLVVD